MSITGFHSPTLEVFQEMIAGNMNLDRSAIDLTDVPKGVLEQAVHTLLIKSFREQSIEKIDMSVGPDDEYHHQVQGLSVIANKDSAIWLQHPKTKNWLAAHISTGKGRQEVLVCRLDEEKEDWDILDPEDEADLKELHWMVYNSLAYLDIVPRPLLNKTSASIRKSNDVV